jgi:hypothetical protein
MLPASAAMATSAAGATSAIPAAAPAGGYNWICANGGAGLCLQQNGLYGSLVANDNKITGSTNYKQLWAWQAAGVSSATAPFADVSLDKEIAPGRQFGFWFADESGPPTLCMGYSSGRVVLESCPGPNDPPNGTLWMLSGSGRMISVGASNDAGALVYLNSSGKNSGNPTLLSILNSGAPNNCPASCWSNAG